MKSKSSIICSNKMSLTKEYLVADKIHDNPYCIIMVGVPRSGKTTIVNNLYRQYGLVIISKDDIRRSLEVRFDKNLEDYVKGIYYNMIKVCITRGMHIVLDECHHIKEKRLNIIKFVNRLGGIPLLYEVERPSYNELTKRCQDTDFPIKVLNDFIKDYEEPDYQIEAPKITQECPNIFHQIKWGQN